MGWLEDLANRDYILSGEEAQDDAERAVAEQLWQQGTEEGTGERLMREQPSMPELRERTAAPEPDPLLEPPPPPEPPEQVRRIGNPREEYLRARQGAYGAINPEGMIEVLPGEEAAALNLPGFVIPDYEVGHLRRVPGEVGTQYEGREFVPEELARPRATTNMGMRVTPGWQQGLYDLREALTPEFLDENDDSTLGALRRFLFTLPSRAVPTTQVEPGVLAYSGYDTAGLGGSPVAQGLANAALGGIPAVREQLAPGSTGDEGFFGRYAAGRERGEDIQNAMAQQDPASQTLGQLLGMRAAMRMPAARGRQLGLNWGELGRGARLAHPRGVTPGSFSVGGRGSTFLRDAAMGGLAGGGAAGFGSQADVILPGGEGESPAELATDIGRGALLGSGMTGGAGAISRAGQTGRAMQQQAARSGLRQLGLDEQAMQDVAERLQGTRQYMEWSPIHERTAAQRALRLPSRTERIYPRLRPRAGGRGFDRGLPAEPFPEARFPDQRDRELLTLFEELRSTRAPTTRSPIPGVRAGGGRLSRRSALENMEEMPRIRAENPVESAQRSMRTNRWRDELTDRAIRGEVEAAQITNPLEVPPGPGRAMRQRSVERAMRDVEQAPVYVPEGTRERAAWLREHGLPTPSEMHPYQAAGEIPRAEQLRSEVLRGVQESNDPSRVAQALDEARQAGERSIARYGFRRAPGVAGRRGLLQTGIGAVADMFDSPAVNESMRGVGRFLDTIQPSALPEQMIQAIQRGPRAITVTHHSLLQTDPAYRQRFQRFEEEQGGESLGREAPVTGPIDVTPTQPEGGADPWSSDAGVEQVDLDALWRADDVEQVSLDEVQ